MKFPKPDVYIYSNHMALGYESCSASLHKILDLK